MDSAPKRTIIQSAEQNRVKDRFFLNFSLERRHLGVESGNCCGSTERMEEAAEAIERLYRAQGPAILGYLRGMVGGSNSAQDLLQQTFLEVLRRPEQLDRAVSPRAWLFGVARRLALNSYRRRENMTSLPAQLEARSSTEDSRIETMRQAITNLPGPMQETLELRLSRDLSYQEIATVLEIPIGTVRSRLHAAVLRLRQVLLGGQK